MNVAVKRKIPEKQHVALMLEAAEVRAKHGSPQAKAMVSRWTAKHSEKADR